MTSHRRARVPRRLAVAVVASFLSMTAGAAAQSAADKATARQVATEGIKLYEEGKYEEALDLLKRAQALFAAPPHLLYIARTQSKLPEPQLVEAAENYRLLIATDLGPSPPPAFVRAVEDGKRELEALEPRIPAMQIDVAPKDARDLELTIDGAPVSAAVIGISRPVNPGKHVVAAAAPGYARTEKKVEIAEGEKQSVLLLLDQSGDGAAAAAGAGSATAATGSEPSAEKKPGLIGFMAGLRLGAAVPGGSLGTVGADKDVSTSEYFKASGGVEIHGGVRFAQIVTAALFAELTALNIHDSRDFWASEEKNTGSSTTAGIKVLVGTPRGRLGGFGELGIGFVHSFDLASKAQEGDNCGIEWKRTAPALRLGGGAVFPLGDLIHLVPFGTLSFSSFNHQKITTTGTQCPATSIRAVDEDIPDKDQGLHTLLFLGVGGDFVFGADRRR